MPTTNVPRELRRCALTDRGAERAEAVRAKAVEAGIDAVGLGRAAREGELRYVLSLLGEDADVDEVRATRVVLVLAELGR